MYLYLLCEIYKNGYYIEWTDDRLFLAAKDNDMSVDETSQIVKFLLERSLLNSILFKSDTIMTGKSIQLRYQEGCAKRKRDIEVDGRFWVLSEKETLSFIKVRPKTDTNRNNSINNRNNSINTVNNSTNESKEKERKLNESKSPAGGALTDEQNKKLTAEYGQTAVNAAYSRFMSWKANNKIPKADTYKGVSKILAEDFKNIKGKRDSSFNISEIEKKTMEKYNA